MDWKTPFESFLRNSAWTEVDGYNKQFLLLKENVILRSRNPWKTRKLWQANSETAQCGVKCDIKCGRTAEASCNSPNKRQHSGTAAWLPASQENPVRFEDQVIAFVSGIQCNNTVKGNSKQEKKPSGLRIILREVLLFSTNDTFTAKYPALAPRSAGRL